MKRKIITIIGILIIIAGVGIFVYPIISQAITSRTQQQLMEDVKQQILDNMIAQNAELEAAEGSSDGTSGSLDESLAGGSSASDGSVAGDSSAAGISGASGTESTVSGTGTDLEGSGNANAGSSASGDASEGSETGTGSAGGSSATLADNLLEDDTDESPEDEGDTLAQSRLIGQKCLGIITIDKINLVYAIVEGTEDYNIGVAIGHFPDSVGIGEDGNCSLAGHNGGVYGRYFGDLKKLSVGDEVVMTNLKGYEYTYVIKEIFVCEPSDMYVVEDLGKPGKFLTMITCTQHGTKRLVVRAECTTEPVSTIKTR